MFLFIHRLFDKYLLQVAVNLKAVERTEYENSSSILWSICLCH